ncbi:hypothetical protein TAMA11512_19380 [Selenomonas sp. TAMA-11512]|uniref:hypothetical protein n=1 Tax=Selenomonas sp. TAMA-11512 TaxID=3095337 RepID=UPI003091FACC|nr:hypothetical protein TAMA11512_19380 [Selenomonas sp. TAMA-11512]
MDLVVDALRNQKGETGSILIELLLVVIILSLLAAAARPLLKMDDYQMLDREAAELAATIRYVQEMSKTEQRKRSSTPSRLMFSRVILDVDAKGYMVTLQSPGGTSLLKKHTVPEGVRVVLKNSAPLRSTIIFLANGDVPMGCMQTITLKKGSMERSIIIDQAGRVRVEKRGVR